MIPRVVVVPMEYKIGQHWDISNFSVYVHYSSGVRDGFRSEGEQGQRLAIIPFLPFSGSATTGSLGCGWLPPHCVQEVNTGLLLRSFPRGAINFSFFPTIYLNQVFVLGGACRSTGFTRMLLFDFRPLALIVTITLCVSGCLVHICCVCQDRREQCPGCSEGICIPSFIQHSQVSVEHTSYGYQQHSRSKISFINRLFCVTGWKEYSCVLE